MYLLYEILLHFAIFILYFIAFFSKKIKANLQIRKLPLSINIPKNKNVYWFHAASSGEYEQIRIIAQLIKKKVKHAFIVISIFSYSGYIQKKNDNIHDLFFPLPFDFTNKMEFLLNRIQPLVIFYARYDVWPNLCRLCHKFAIKQYLVSASLPQTSYRNKPTFSYIYRKIYKNLTSIFTINHSDTQKFCNLGLKNIITLGDTRFDSILEKSRKNSVLKNEVLILQSKLPQKKIFLGGSTYNTSHHFLLNFIKKNNKEYFLILVPHEMNNIPSLVELIKQKNIKYILYSTWKKNTYTHKIGERNLKNIDVLIIDELNYLIHLYSICNICYVGGGWKGSIHSVLEPAYYGLPIITGPAINNSLEALEMNKNNLLYIMQDQTSQSIEQYLGCLDNTHLLKHKKKVQSYFKYNCGATQKLLEFLNI